MINGGLRLEVRLCVVMSRELRFLLGVGGGVVVELFRLGVVKGLFLLVGVLPEVGVRLGLGILDGVGCGGLTIRVVGVWVLVGPGF